MVFVPAPLDDGLVIPEVGSWTEEKYRIVHAYQRMFTTAMHGKWDALVYIDLFAGAGWARIRETKQVVLSSSLFAMELDHPFDGYVLCEQNRSYLDALKTRVASHYPAIRTRFLHGDCNSSINDILGAMDGIAAGGSQLAFCFVDPLNLRSLKFGTIMALAERRVDFVVLIATEMDARRNRELYEKPGITVVDEFLGDPGWRAAWEKSKVEGMPFVEFLVDHFGAQMERHGYRYRGIEKTKLIQAQGHKGLYRLAFFSGNKLGDKFWDEAVRYGPEQRRLPEI